jgi:DNA-binding SARP family transcriptional activator
MVGAGASSACEFRILGPPEAWRGGARLAIRSTRQQKLLAVLLLNSDRVVSHTRLVDALWDGDPPATAVKQVQNCVSSLREQLGDGEGRTIATDGPGYRFVLGPHRLDLAEFDERTARARRSADDDPTAAVAELRRALALWRGPAFQGLDSSYLTAGAARLSERRIATVELCHEWELELGRHAELIDTLTSLAAEHPFRERLYGQLMLALYRDGRRAEALAVFSRIRGRLADELGLDVGPDLGRLHRDILRGEAPSTGRAAVTGSTPPATVPAVALPRQLPTDVASFTGRRPELALLDAALFGEPRAGADASRTVVVSGMPGVGKTALAVRWANRSADRYPDGVVFLDLQGHADAAPLAPGEAVAYLLMSLGVTAQQLPAGLASRTALYRSLTAGRRLLLVFDDPAGVEQVRPLLPGNGTCGVIIASRDHLRGLVALDDARHLHLDVLSEAESLALLGTLLGRLRRHTEPAAIRRLAALCAHLPLALRVAAATLISRPHDRVESLLPKLARNRLTALAIAGDRQAAVRTSFDRSFVALPRDAQGMFRVLGRASRTEFTEHVAAELVGTSVGAAERLLDHLHTVSLVNRLGTGGYRLHALLREYAGSLAPPVAEAMGMTGR